MLPAHSHTAQRPPPGPGTLRLLPLLLIKTVQECVALGLSDLVPGRARYSTKLAVLPLDLVPNWTSKDPLRDLDLPARVRAPTVRTWLPPDERIQLADLTGMTVSRPVGKKVHLETV